jgi:hypothetical protein
MNPSSPARFCRGCGQEYVDDSVFCAGCGARRTQVRSATSITPRPQKPLEGVQRGHADDDQQHSSGHRGYDAGGTHQSKARSAVRWRVVAGAGLTAIVVGTLAAIAIGLPSGEPRRVSSVAYTLGEPYVATVQTAPITLKTAQHWMRIAAAAAAAADGRSIGVSRPPEFRSCVKRLSRSDSRAGSPRRSKRQLRGSCLHKFTALQAQVMTFLIRSRWLETEARELKIHVSGAAVQAALARARIRAFPRTGQYAKFLRRTRQTEGDLLFRQRSQTLEQRITKKVRSRVRQSQRSKVLAAFGRRYQRKWQRRTKCQPGWMVADCSGYKKRRKSS